MPDVVCNTSPLQYLHQIGCLHLLPSLYGRIVIPDSVVREIEAGRAQGVDLPNFASLTWIEFRHVEHFRRLPLASELGKGELEVLAIAAEKSDSVVVLDDSLARRYAQQHGILVTGTCGILLKAKAMKLLPVVSPTLDRLSVCGFYLADSTKAAMLRLAGED